MILPRMGKWESQFAADYADGRRWGRMKMSQELNNPRVLERLAWSIPAGLLAAVPGLFWIPLQWIPLHRGIFI
jgi:hypothetical protein